MAKRKLGKKQEHDPMVLTPREALFVLKVIELNELTAAYVAAGYRGKPKSLHANAARLIARDRVRLAVEKARKVVLDEALVDAAEAYRRIQRIADFDPIEMFDDAGDPLPLGKIPKAARRCIKAIRLKPWGKEVVAHDSMRACELIAESGGLLKKRVEADVHLFDHLGLLEKIAKEDGLK